MVNERYKYLLEFMDNEVSSVDFFFHFFQTNFSDENISPLDRHVFTDVSRIMCENLENNVFLRQFN